MDEGINTMWSIRTVNYYAAVKRNEVLMNATNWMTLENYVPCERSQSQKPEYGMTHFCELSK